MTQSRSSAADTVDRLIRTQSAVHAVLLYGVSGPGAELLAMRLAEGWMCVAASGQPCGECAACKSLAKGNAADLQIYRPDGKSGQILVSAVRRGPNDRDLPYIPISEFFRTRPLMAANKVVVITGADRMHSRAANALLKTLEEPNPRCKLILTTSAVSRVLPTILSRCLCIACELPSTEELIAEYGDLPAHEWVLSRGDPAELERIRKAGPIFEHLCQFSGSLSAMPLHGALAVSEAFRDLCDEAEKALGLNARAAQLAMLEGLASLLAADVGAPPEWSQRVIEAHRRVQGMGNLQLVTDAMFAVMLS